MADGDDAAPAPQPPTRLKRGWRRVWKWIKPPLLALLGLAFLLALFALEENARGWWQLREARRMAAADESAAAARGDVMQPASAEEAAAADRLQAAHEKLKKRIREHEEIASLLFYRTTRPGERRPLDQGATAMVAGREEGQEETLDWATLGAALQAAEGELQEVRAALGGPCAARFDATKLSPEIKVVISASAWLKASVLWHLHRGEQDAVVRDLVFLLKLPGFYDKNGDDIAQTLRLGLVAYHRDALWAALNAGNWRDEDLAKVQEGLPRGINWMAVEQSFGLLRTHKVEFIRQARDSPQRVEMALRMETVGSFSDMLEGKEDPPPPSEFSIFLRSRAWRVLWSLQDEAAALRNSNELQVKIHALVTERNWNKARMMPPLPSASVGSLWNQTRFILSDMLTSAATLDSLLKKQVIMTTRMELATAYVALKRYQFRHGALSERLRELVPEILAEVPHDWMNGQPLRYQRKEGGKFLLYSVGLDGVDDGGNPLPADPKKKPQFLEGRDLVWPEGIVER